MRSLFQTTNACYISAVVLKKDQSDHCIRTQGERFKEFDVAHYWYAHELRAHEDRCLPQEDDIN
jgi:hypothetical protein